MTSTRQILCYFWFYLRLYSHGFPTFFVEKKQRILPRFGVFGLFPFAYMNVFTRFAKFFSPYSIAFVFTRVLFSFPF